MILDPMKMFREITMVNWNIGAPTILSFLNKLMKSWKNRAGPGVDSGKIMMVGMIQRQSIGKKAEPGVDSGKITMAGKILRIMVDLADKTIFKQMNILFE